MKQLSAMATAVIAMAIQSASILPMLAGPVERLDVSDVC